MQFFTKEVRSPVILITSSLAEDGKTFVAINLASVYSLMGMKTVLVGFDLRRPKIYNNFNTNNEHGLSTWLIGKDELKDVVKATGYKNLFILPSGPVPPNPAELVALHKTKELVDLLRDNFDCIIIDSSPIGLVSDTYHLASLADSCLYVIRIEKTFKEKIAMTLNEMRLSGITSVSLILNDVKANSKTYGYGGKNVYTKDKKKETETNSGKVEPVSTVKT
jgi:capsular exopolysaccharide synthesis family protein